MVRIKGRSELTEKGKSFHFVGIPTTETQRRAKKTKNTRLPIPLQSEAFD